VTVLSSCTGVKAGGEGEVLEREHFARGRGYVEERHRCDLAPRLRPAEQVYRGQQHQRLMRGVRAAREVGTINVDLNILSAGYGLIRGDEVIAPYECSFQGMAPSQRRAWAGELGVPHAVRQTLASPSLLTIVLLGDDYLDSCGLDATFDLGGPTLVFCGAQAALRLPALPRLRPVRLTTAHTRAFHCGLVGLKGEVAGRLLVLLSNSPVAVEDLSAETVLDDLAACGPIAPTSDPALLALF
jgi:hypothetical protein